ncbi:hypothetical protein MOSE0_K08922 [Monosporozyma servazzii]
MIVRSGKKLNKSIMVMVWMLTIPFLKNLDIPETPCLVNIVSIPHFQRVVSYNLLRWLLHVSHLTRRLVI